MADDGIRCSNCGTFEAAGTLFCGNCGAQLVQSVEPGRLPTWLSGRPLLSAFLGGLGFAVVAVFLLAVLGSDGGSPPAGGDGSDGRSAVSANATSAPTSGPQDEAKTPEAADTASAAAEVETPEPSATSVPATSTQVPPTATLAPTSTSVPPTSTPLPPTAASAPAIPLERTSQYVALSVTGGHGSSHRIGEQIIVCYGSLAGQYIRLLDYQPPGTLNSVIREGVDDGNGECISGIVEGPVGFEVFRIEAWNSTLTGVVDYAELWIRVIP